MQVGISLVCEARIGRAEVKAIVEGLQGNAVVRQEIMVTKAMSVRLRSPDGGFFIEGSSPETQWIDNVLGLPAEDYARWRWTITPRERGRKRLQLVVSARTVLARTATLLRGIFSCAILEGSRAAHSPCSQVITA